MKNIFLIFLTLLAGYAYGYEERNLLQKTANVSRLKETLILNQDWVSYPDYGDRQAWDQLTGIHKKQLIENGEKALDFQWIVIKASDYLEFERSGSRQIMESPFGANATAIKDLILAELAEGEGRFMDQIINGVWFFCEMSTWSLSAHLPGRPLPDVNKPIIDLTVGDMGSFFSWTYHFLKNPMDEINPLVSTRLRQNLQERVLDPFMERSDFWWQAFTVEPGGMINNWNPWCNFNVLSAFLLLENNPEKLAAAVYKTMESVDRFINYNHEDGACEEGPSYWGHAAGKLYDYLEILNYGTGGKVSIFEQPIIKNLGEYIARSYIGNGWVVNFADASAKGGGYPGIVFRYGKAVQSDVMKGFGAYLSKKYTNKSYIDGGRDLFRTFENLRTFDEVNTVNPSVVNTPYSWYPQTEFCYMRQGEFFFAAKGGYNAESHNHNDIGSFILYHKNTPVLIDAGVGTYTRQTFSRERYSIWTMQSEYHNLPVINGKGQIAGKQYRSKNAKFDPRRMTFSLDISEAYPEEARVKSWVRSYRLDRRSRQLTISDAFELSEVTGDNEVVFMTVCKPDLQFQKGAILLPTEHEIIKLNYNPKIFEASFDTIPLDDPKLSNIWGNELYRVKLRPHNRSKKGNYSFTISK